MLDRITEKVPYLGEMTAWVTTPTDFDPEKESLPVVVFLHGAGERPTPETVLTTGLPKLMAENNDYRGLRFIMIAPCCPEGHVWNHLHMQAMEVIDKLVKRYNGDPDRVTITGLSMGGYGTWDIAANNDGYFAAAAPLCGGGLVWMVGNITVPVRAFHGEADATVPVDESIRMVERLKQEGGNVTLTTYPGVGHNCWDYVYGETDLVEWLVNQHR